MPIIRFRFVRFNRIVDGGKPYKRQSIWNGVGARSYVFRTDTLLARKRAISFDRNENGARQGERAVKHSFERSYCRSVRGERRRNGFRNVHKLRARVYGRRHQSENSARFLRVKITAEIAAGRLPNKKIYIRRFIITAADLNALQTLGRHHVKLNADRLPSTIRTAFVLFPFYFSSFYSNPPSRRFEWPKSD